MATSIRLAPDTEKRLNELAARTGRIKAFYLREAVEEYLDDMEDYYLAGEVRERVRTWQGKNLLGQASEGRAWPGRLCTRQRPASSCARMTGARN